jgi:hypothetical protein
VLLLQGSLKGRTVALGAFHCDADQERRLVEHAKPGGPTVFFEVLQKDRGSFGDRSKAKWLGATGDPPPVAPEQGDGGLRSR